MDNVYFYKHIHKEAFFMWKQRLSIMVLCLLFCVVLANPVGAAANVNTITVNGHAELAINPDIAYITTGVVTVDKEVSAARAANDRTMQQVFAALAELRVPRERIQTTGFSIQPLYDYNSSRPEREIIGYRVQNTITVATTDLANIGYIIDAAARAGANHFQSVRFGIQNEAALETRLLQLAVKDGQKKAQLIAKTLGHSVGAPLSVTESNLVKPLPFETQQIALKADAVGATPITPGLITASADLHMVFVLNSN